MVDTNLLHPPLLSLHERENIGENLHHLLVLEEGELQGMIIIGDQHLLEFLGNPHNVLTMFWNMGEVAQSLTILILNIS